MNSPAMPAENNVYNVTIVATDNTNNSGTLQVTVTVLDINEDPQFAAETDTRDIAEGLGPIPISERPSPPPTKTEETR